MGQETPEWLSFTPLDSRLEALSTEATAPYDTGHSLHCLWPQALQVVLMTIMPPHLQQYS